jgi:subtilisin family serine protease
MLLVAIFMALPIKAFESKYRFQVNNNQNYNLLTDTKLNKNRLFKDQLIVKFKPGTTKLFVNQFAKRENLTLLKKLKDNLYVFKALKVNQIQNLMKNFELQSYERNFFLDSDNILAIDIDELRKISIDKFKSQVVRIDSNVTKDFSTKQWYLENNGINGLKENCDINAKEAWKLSSGAGVLVAVIDTGFDLAHPDINYFNSGFDVINHVANASAPNFSNENHATAVAGLISARDNGFGVTGVAPSAQIIPIRMISDDGYVEVSSIIEAHYKAVEMGARIINNSWGSTNDSLELGSEMELTELEKEMYEDIYKNSHGGKGTLIIFSSGNSSSSNLYNSPEARSSYTLAVGSTDSTDQRVSFSNYGQGLDLVAPGGGSRGIYTTDRGDIKIMKKSELKKLIRGYQKGDYTTNFSGTSASAPIVAGVAALVLSLNQELSANELKNILINSANKNLHPKYNFDENGWNKEVGYGRVDAKQALDLSLRLVP